MQKAVKFILILSIIALTFATWVQCEPSKLIELNFKNADLKDVFRALADQEGVSILVDEAVTGTITVHLTKITFRDALAILTKNNNLNSTFENQTYHISKANPTILNVSSKNNRLSVEAKDAKLPDLLEKVSRESGRNLIASPELQNEKITLNFNDCPVEDGINIIIAQANCLAEKKGETLIIRKKKTDSPPFSVTFQDNALSVDAQNVPVQALTRELTEKTGVSVVPDQGVAANITVFFKNLPLRDGLAVLCDTNNLLLFQDDSVWRISRKTANYRVKIKDGILSIDADSVDVVTVINEIARQSGENIILAKEVRGSITAHFQDLPLQQGLSTILETQGWVLEKQAKYYYIRVNGNQNPNIRIIYDPKTERFDLDVQSAPVSAIINDMARKADLNVVVLAQVSWTVNNLRLQEMKFSQVLDFMLKGTAFTYKQIDNVYLVGDTMLRPENQDFSVIKIYPVKYLKVDQLLSTLPQSFPRQNFTPLVEKNAVILSGTSAVHDAFQNYLQQIDIQDIEDHTEVIKIKNLKAEDILKLIPPSIPKTDIIVIKEMNALTVTGPQNVIEQVKQYIAKIDQINPMIVFDIKVISINSTDSTTWTPPGQIPISPSNYLLYDLSSGSLNVTNQPITTTIQWLISNGKAKLLQNPTISTLNGYQTSFKVSTKRVYNVTDATNNSSSSSTTATTTYHQVTFDTGLTINITPWVSSTNQITMDIEPSYSEYIPLSGSAGGSSVQSVGSTSERTTKTTMRLADKQTVIISGLKGTTRNKSVSKIPLLGDIPLLGYLFRSEEYKDQQDEFVILITPTLVYDTETKEKVEEKTKDKFGAEVQDEMNQKSAETENKK